MMLSHEYDPIEVNSNQWVTKTEPYATPVCFSEDDKLKI